MIKSDNKMQSVNSFDLSQQSAVQYPAEFHFRVICDAQAAVEDSIAAVATQYQVSGCLQRSNSSSAGRFQAYGISVVFKKHDEMVNFDSQIKAIPGVRMLL
ncbi:MAG: DUF493 family protein [Petrimonas sp.]|jgi:putative lipoic acid-binding regulatory protein|nr:DUF493 family protein [Petrimonas sp.]